MNFNMKNRIWKNLSAMSMAFFMTGMVLGGCGQTTVYAAELAYESVEFEEHSETEETGIEAQYVGELISATTGTDTLDGYFVVSIIDDERIGDIRQQVEELISDYKVDLGDGSISYTVNRRDG